VGQDVARLSFVQAGDLSLGQRCDHEFSLAEMTAGIRKVVGQPAWAPLEVRLGHPRPPSIATHEAFFCAPVVFGAARPEILTRASDLRLPMLRADRMLARFLERHAEELLAKIADAPDELTAVKRVIIEELSRGAREESVAARLAMGVRTLRRHLKDRGRSFRALVDEVRRELAERHLEEGRLDIGEISDLLGFSEPSAFHRAFRRWTGTAPQRFRARARAPRVDARSPRG
jgi:AraC-like DNA-binding protein